MVELPSGDTIVSIFKELETRQKQKQEEVDGCKECDKHHGEWSLLGFNDQVFACFGHLSLTFFFSSQVAALTWLEGSLMLEIRLGEKLKPKKSRKTMGGNKRIEHHVVNSFQWRSLHLTNEDEEDEDRLGDVVDTETDKCISEAHSCLTRRFSPAVMSAECLNTYRLVPYGYQWL